MSVLPAKARAIAEILGQRVATWRVGTCDAQLQNIKVQR